MVGFDGSVEIDRIRITGVELTPEGAERVRVLVEEKLGRLLMRADYGEGLAAADLSSVRAPALSLSPGRSETQLADGLARSIAAGLLRSK